MSTLLLASASPVRARLLEAAGVALRIAPARIDEAAVRDSLLAEGAAPRDIADRLAELKAQTVSTANPGALVIGADQVLEFRGSVIGKSPDLASARALLRSLSGARHNLVTAAAIARDGAVLWRHVTRVGLDMRELSEAFLDAYLASEGEAILGSVGCYHLEGRGAQLFSRIDGDYFAVLGLPLLSLLDALRHLGAVPS